MKHKLIVFKKVLLEPEKDLGEPDLATPENVTTVLLALKLDSIKKVVVV
jgi:hypothetical protein